MSPKYNHKEAKQVRMEDEKYSEEDFKEKQKHKKQIKDIAKQNKNIDRRT